MSSLRRLSARWVRLALPNAPCARSSHKISALEGRAYVFGGEAEARHAIDSAVFEDPDKLASLNEKELRELGRLAYPMLRSKGSRRFQRISWDDALDLVASKLKPLRDAGTPELFMYQYGRHKASQAATM